MEVHNKMWSADIDMDVNEPMGLMGIQLRVPEVQPLTHELWQHKWAISNAHFNRVSNHRLWPWMQCLWWFLIRPQQGDQQACGWLWQHFNCQLITGFLVCTACKTIFQSWYSATSIQNQWFRSSTKTTRTATVRSSLWTFYLAKTWTFTIYAMRAAMESKLLGFWTLSTIQNCKY
jgi:hypothetical protein